MKRWAGPFACALVFAVLARTVPSPESCAVGSESDSAWTSGFRAPALEVSGSVPASESPASSSSPDPFALAPVPETAPKAAMGAHRPSGPAPARPWTVTGLVGARAAVLVKVDGTSRVVSVGQRLDSAVVVGISPAGVEIEDRGGRVLLKVR